MPHKPAVPTDHERPETYPVYLTVEQVHEDGWRKPVVVGMKRTGMDTYFPDDQILHHDPAGRLLRIAQPNVQWRRGLSGRMIELRRRTRERGGGLDRRMLDDTEADQRVAEAADRMRGVAAALRGSEPADARGPRESASFVTTLREFLEAAARFDAPAARADVAQFRALYHDIPVLPPDQYASLVLAATDGCRYNQCTFCGLYRDTHFHAKTAEEFAAHVQAALAFHGHSRVLRRNIFLGHANALVGSRPWREEILRIIGRACELPHAADTAVAPAWWQGSLTRFAGITSFLDAFVGARITADEFTALRQLNLRQIYIGLESGSDLLLKWLRKPATAAHVLDTVRAAKAGGVRVGLIVLLGAGGERHFEHHVRDTVHIIDAMKLQPGDHVYLSPLVAASGAEYAQRAEADGIRPLTAARLAEQERCLRRGMQRGPYVARYDLEHFVY